MMHSMHHRSFQLHFKVTKVFCDGLKCCLLRCERTNFESKQKALRFHSSWSESQRYLGETIRSNSAKVMNQLGCRPIRPWPGMNQRACPSDSQNTRPAARPSVTGVVPVTELGSSRGQLRNVYNVGQTTEHGEYVLSFKVETELCEMA